MAVAPLDEDIYPEPMVSRPRSGFGMWRVVLLAVVLIVLAAIYAAFSESIPPDAMLLVLGLLAVVGVFCLFALASGLFRIASGEERRTLPRVVIDSLPFGAVVTDREGKIAYANAHYGSFPGAVSNGVPVSVTRLFAGRPEASEAVYRLSRAAQDGRPASEDIRLVGGLEGGEEDAGRPFWYRVGVRALPAAEGIDRPLVLWSVEEITRAPLLRERPSP